MKFEAWPVEPPGLGSGPLSSSTTSRQPSRTRWYARLLPTIPQPMTTQRACAGTVTSSFRLVGRAHFLGQLVPTHAVAHLRAHAPFQRLRLRLDRAPYLIQPRARQPSVDVELVERVPQLGQVELQRAVQAPLLGGQSRHVVRVDGLVVVRGDG